MASHDSFGDTASVDHYEGEDDQACGEHGQSQLRIPELPVLDSGHLFQNPPELFT